MLLANVIGYLGSDAEVKSADGREFVTFRVAHSERWKSQDGIVHESTQWIDCTMDGRPGVLPYLVKGTLIFAAGSIKARVFSSAKDHCMKAGLTISVRQLELLGGKADEVPSRLVDASGCVHEISKWFHCNDLMRDENAEEWLTLVHPRSSAIFSVDRAGWVYPESKAGKEVADGQE